MAVRVARDPSRPAILLLHGFPSSSLSFRDVMSLSALSRMAAHVLDGPHFLLETHAAACAGGLP